MLVLINRKEAQDGFNKQVEEQDVEQIHKKVKMKKERGAIKKSAGKNLEV